MLRWIFERMRAGRRPSGRVVDPPPPPPPPPGCGPQALHGSQFSCTTSINGVPVPDAAFEQAEVLTTDGRVCTARHTGVVVLGDGSVTDNLARGYSRCDICWAIACGQLEAGIVDTAGAHLASLCRSSRIRRSRISGLALCPKHARVVEVDGQTATVSVLEADEIDRQRRLGLPVRILGDFLFVRGP